MRPDALNELFVHLSRRAGLERPIHPHQLRHSFGTNLTTAGGSLDEVQDLLGAVQRQGRRGRLPVPVPLIDEATATLRATRRSVHLGMPTIGPPTPDPALRRETSS